MEWFVTVVIGILCTALTLLWSIYPGRRRHQFGVLAAGKRRITLKSSDSVLFEVSEEIANQMKVVQELAEDHDFFPIPNVTFKVLAKVVEYCEQHALEPENGRKSSKELEKWDMNFASNGGIMFQLELIMAANYLNVESLQELMSKTLAKSLQGRSVEEVRKIYGVENDYTPEEEAALRKEYHWAFE